MMSSQKHLIMTNRPYFGWVNTDTIRDTFKNTTKWGVSIGTYPMKTHLKSRNPALNVPRRHEAVATDIVYSDTPAVDSGVKQAQRFVGRESLTEEKLYIVTGPEFEDWEGYIHTSPKHSMD